jgi:hypothetical protein
VRGSVGRAAAALLVLAGGAAMSQDDGLLAWWRFDEGQGARTADAAGGLVDRIRRPVWVAGAHGRALAFDGAGTWVTRPAEHAPQLTSDFALEAWVAVREYPPTWTPFVNQHACPDAGFFFGLEQSGVFGLHVSVGGQWLVCNSTTPLSKGEWHHIAGIYHERTGVEVYLDGKLTGQLAAAGRVPTAAGVDLLIGRHNYGAWVFDGIIDEVKIHGRALSAAEIASAAATGAPTGAPRFPAPATGSPVDPSLEAWWRFDEGKGSSTVEAVTGTADVIEGPTWVAGSTNTGLLLDGKRGWVRRAASEAPLMTPDFTIEAWVALREYPEGWVPIVNQHRAPDAGFFFGVNDAGFFGLHVAVGGEWHVCNSDVTIPRSRWVHLAGVYTAGAGIQLYIDGQLAGGQWLTGRVPTADDVDLLIGRHNHSAAVLNGIIDEVKIHNRGLSGMELVILSAAGTPAGAPDFRALGGRH